MIVPILGRPIFEGAASGPPPASLPQTVEIVGTASPIMSTANVASIFGATGVIAVAWPSGNKPFAIPFCLNEPATAYQIGWRNSSAGNNIDVGIYTRDWVRLVSSGSVATSGNNALQFANITDTILPRGHYYLVVCRDATSGDMYGWTPAPTLAGNKLMGIMDSGTNAFPLPDPLTNMVRAATFTIMPRMYIALRLLV